MTKGRGPTAEGGRETEEKVYLVIVQGSRSLVLANEDA
jgi:hypothetical protein